MVQRELCGCGAAAVVLASAAAWGQQAKLTELPALGTDGRAFAVSADGVTVVGDSGGQAFVWSAATGAVPLGGARATGVSRHGEVICGYAGVAGASSMRSVRWTSWSAAAMVDLTTFGVGSYSCANGVSADGMVVVGNAFDGDFDTVAYRWAGGAAAVVGATPYTGGVGTTWGAQATSADGTVVVGNTGVSGPAAFRWVSGLGLSSIVGAPESSALAVSADGSVVAGYYKPTPSAGKVAFRWTSAESAADLPDLAGGAENATATAITADGAIIVGWGTSDSGQEAFIWDATHGTRNLRDVFIADGEPLLAGWTLTSATGITPDGKVYVGYGTNPQGQVRAWRVGYECYANCDGSTAAPVLNVADFSCFLQKFASGDPYANCDGSTSQPVLSVIDFTCFLQRFTAGCS
jgi:uncharacterized membrane protein